MTYIKPHEYEARLILGAKRKPSAKEHPEEAKKEIERIVAHAKSHGTFACYLEWNDEMDLVFIWGSNEDVIAFRDCMKLGGKDDNDD